MTEDNEPSHGIFYIDGSCRPNNPGFIGWGIHGYIYKNISDKPFTTEQFNHTTHGYVSVFNTLPASCQHVVPYQYVDGFGSYLELQTNNVAEILGMMNLFERICLLKLKSIRVYTDSDYLKTALTERCKRWEQNGWLTQDGTPVKNKELLEKTYGLLKQIRNQGCDVHIHWIRSHTGHLGNEKADVLAGIGMSHSYDAEVLNSFEFSPAKGYNKFESNRNPFLAYRRLYFNSIASANRPGVYYLTDSDDPEILDGKPSATACYSIVYLEEPDKIIEAIKAKQFEVSSGINVISMLKMDSVFSKNVYPWIDQYGKRAIMPQKNSHSLVTVDKKPITVEQNPTGLSLRVLDHFIFLEQILTLFYEYSSKTIATDTNNWFYLGGHKVQVHDITSHFYTQKETIVKTKGSSEVIKKINSELISDYVVGFKDTKIPVTIEFEGKELKLNIPYILGMDILPRNNLKRIENEEPKIYLLTWSEGQILKYTTIVTSKLGFGIWSNLFANQILLPK